MFNQGCTLYGHLFPIKPCAIRHEPWFSVKISRGRKVGTYRSLDERYCFYPVAVESLVCSGHSLWYSSTTLALWSLPTHESALEFQWCFNIGLWSYSVVISTLLWYRMFKTDKCWTVVRNRHSLTDTLVRLRVEFPKFHNTSMFSYLLEKDW